MFPESITSGIHEAAEGIDGRAGIAKLRWIGSQLDGRELVEAHGVVGDHIGGIGRREAPLGLSHLAHHRHEPLPILGGQGGGVDAEGLGRAGDGLVVDT